ncbi:MAG: OmpA family protein [Chromatiales bacterium]|nr:OmpA family protein [Chromatiales bacterium]
MASGAATVPLGRVVWMVGLAVVISLSALAVLETYYLDLGIVREQLADSQGELRRMKSELQGSQQQAQSVRQQWEAIAAERDRLRDETRELSIRLASAEKADDSISNRINGYQTTIETLKTEAGQLRNQLASALKDKESLDSELAKRDVLRDELLAANQALNEGLRRVAPEMRPEPDNGLKPALLDAARVLDLVWSHLSENRRQLADTETEVQRLHILLEQSEKAAEQSLTQLRAEKSALEARLRVEAGQEVPAVVSTLTADSAMDVLRQGFGVRQRQGQFELRFDESGNTVIHLGNELLFGPGQAFVKSEGQDLLRELAAVLNRYPDRQLRVQGHTDSLPLTGTLKKRYASNWELASARANATIRYLQYALGVDPERIVSIAYGPYQPIADNRTPEGRARNRRIEIVLVRDDTYQANTALAVGAGEPQGGQGASRNTENRVILLINTGGMAEKGP